MSGLRVNTLRGETAGSSPTFPDGVVVTGVITATSFSGNLTGDVTGNVVGNVTGNVSGNITGTTGTFSGNVSVGGTLTYEDVTNVDSVGVITARSGIRIGAGQSVSAVSGIVTYYGDGSQLTGVESGVGNFVASGTIPNGATVVINTDGTVGIVTSTGSDTPSTGSPFEFQNSGTSYISATFDSTNGKVIIVYRNDSDSDKGKAIVGTVSGTSITYGTAVEFTTANTQEISVAYDSANERVVIAYQDSANSDHGTAIVGTVSGTSISFGSEVVFHSGSTFYTSCVYDSTNGKVVIAYQDRADSSKGKVVVGTVSGTSISFGSEVIFNSGGETQYISAAYDSTNERVVIVYRDVPNNSYGTAIVGTVAGTGIGFGSAVVFESANTRDTKAVFDSTNGKVVIAYRDVGNSQYGTAIVGTVSGTSISFGTAVVFNSAESDSFGAAYDSTNNRVVFAYRDVGNSSHSTAIVGTVSGTSISFSSEVVFMTNSSAYYTAAFDSTNGKVVIGFNDGSDGGKGKAVVFSTTQQVANLTSENYIGITAEAISNGATGKVNILGGVNTGQTGLTTAQTYYVQTNGTLATSAGNPSVVAGTAISSTKVLIWKS